MATRKKSNRTKPHRELVRRAPIVAARLELLRPAVRGTVHELPLDRAHELLAQIATSGSAKEARALMAEAFRRMPGIFGATDPRISY